jgi:hypothetical protein
LRSFADVVEVRVCRDDAANGSTETLRRLNDGGGAAREARINEGEAVVFLDQEAIDHAKAREPNQAAGFSDELHGRAEWKYLTRNRRKSLANHNTPTPHVFHKC